MTAIRPVAYIWDGEHMVPLPRFVALCNKQFVVGQEYALDVFENRRLGSHRGFMAQVHRVFENLREEYDGKFPTEKHFRCWALVKCGFATETDYVLDTPKDAKQMAAAIRKNNEYAIIQVSGNVVKVFEAESQKMYGVDAMKKDRFEESKKAVLDFIAPMANTTPAEVRREADRDSRPAR